MAHKNDELILEFINRGKILVEITSRAFRTADGEVFEDEARIFVYNLWDRTWGLAKLTYGGNGLHRYPRVSVHLGPWCGRKRGRVHLLAQRIIGVSKDGPSDFDYDHRDGDKTNFRRSNLEAVPHSVNMERMFARQRMLKELVERGLDEEGNPLPEATDSLFTLAAPRPEEPF